jgi:hypothetical protein
MATIDGKLKEVLTKWHPNPKGAVWDCHGKWIAYHAALEEIARNAKITFDAPVVLEADGQNKCAALCVTGRMGAIAEWSIGEAAPANNKNGYPFAMAEKRAKDRVILKLIGLHGEVYSEEEADDFKKGPAPEPEKPAPKEPEAESPVNSYVTRALVGIAGMPNVKALVAWAEENKGHIAALPNARQETVRNAYRQKYETLKKEAA